MVNSTQRILLIIYAFTTAALGIAYYVGSRDHESAAALAGFFNFMPDRHLMRNTSLLLLIISIFNFLALTQSNGTYTMIATGLNVIITLHEVMEAFVFGMLNLYASLAVLVIMVLVFWVSLQRNQKNQKELAETKKTS